MVASKQHRKQVLIFNQNLLDLVSCFSLGAIYAAKLGNVYLDGTGGHWLCLVVFSEGSAWGPVTGSMVNLAAISIKRYLRIVRSGWAKEKLRGWMIYSAVALAWASGTVIAAAVSITTSGVVRGVCFSRFFWKSQATRMAYVIWYILFFFVIILSIITFCYWRILVVFRRHASVMAAHDAAGPSTGTAHIKSKQIQISMILVSALLVITWAPANIYGYLNTVSKNRPSKNAMYFVIIVAHIYLCINPFIYATKFNPVRRVLLRLIPCNKTTQPIESVE